MIPVTRSASNKFTERENTVVVRRGRGKGAGAGVPRAQRLLWNDEKLPDVESGGGCTRMWTTQRRWIALLEMATVLLF